MSAIVDTSTALRGLVMVGIPAVLWVLTLSTARASTSEQPPTTDTAPTPLASWVTRRGPLLFLAVTLPLALMKLWGGWTTHLDLGLYSSFLLELRTGNFTSLFFPHFSPALLVLVPLTLFGSQLVPLLLTVTKVTCVAAGLRIFCGLAQRHAGADAPLLAALFCLCYPLSFLALGNFSLEPIWFLIMAATCRAWVDQEKGKFLLLALAATLVKTHLAIAVAFFGVAPLFRRGWRATGVVLIATVVLLVAAEYLWLRPWAQQWVEMRVSETPLLQITRGQPWGVAQGEYWLLAGTLFFATGAQLPWRAWHTAILALPVFAYLALPMASSYLQLEHHYTLAALPFIFLALVTASTPERPLIAPRSTLRWLLLLGAIHLLCAPTPVGQRFWRSNTHPYSYQCYLPTLPLGARAALVASVIPADASVCIENDIVCAPLLLPRVRHLFPAGLDHHCDFVVLSTTGGAWYLDQVDPQRYAEGIQRLEQDYTPLISGAGLTIYTRRR